MQKWIHEDERYVEIWLTKAESQDTNLREGLKSLFQEYKQKKYRVVVFSSGKGDLLTLTKDLLKHTLETHARNEVEAERKLKKLRLENAQEDSLQQTSSTSLLLSKKH